MTETTDVVETEEHRHIWRALSIDWSTMRIRYSCSCGAAKEERARRRGWRAYVLTYRAPWLPPTVATTASAGCCGFSRLFPMRGIKLFIRKNAHNAHFPGKTHINAQL
jgi:hypothetical protein